MRTRGSGEREGVDTFGAFCVCVCVWGWDQCNPSQTDHRDQSVKRGGLSPLSSNMIEIHKQNMPNQLTMKNMRVISIY